MRIDVKDNLTAGQIVRLLCVGRRRNLLPAGSILQRSRHMSNETKIIARVAQGLLAVAATGATVLILQLALLA